VGGKRSAHAGRGGRSRRHAGVLRGARGVCLALAASVASGGAACASAQSASLPGRVADDVASSPAELTLPVTDTTVDRVTRVIGPRLVLEVERDAGIVRGTNWGWRVAVRDAADTSDFNLLYPTVDFHGPYLNDVLAWSEATSRFGRGVRTMDVRGHPWLVDVECVRCTVTGALPDSARFTAGTLRVAWRRAPRR